MGLTDINELKKYTGAETCFIEILQLHFSSVFGVT